jgi:ABC-type antimicrobial peptide transport system permease subunit
VRAAGTPASVISMMKQEVRALDPGLALFNAVPMSDATAISLLPARVAGNLLGGLGLFALLLAALGIYGVLSFLVRARTREIGIRVAVGATPREVAALVVRQALRWTAIGAVIGIGLALALTRLLESFLYGINATDPWTFGGVTLLLVIVALAAALIPALRASRLEPTVALRSL